MSKILIVSGHTDLKNNSFANKIILGRLNEILPEAEYVYLDSEYPDFRFDVEKEQNRLRSADIIVMQFPFFWYGVPSLMHKWMEDVFVHGFSHGSKGKALTG
ncbi:MAG: NAD(P)H-dependent oxidoreductase, partial [Synergistaceae bacterium]|nr:NAD(P)H-dependent oxidoreductase [Synergistaceae bacterium]